MKAKGIVDDAVRSIRAMPANMLGDDSPLADAWEEIKVQVQGEMSCFWQAYLDTMNAIIAGSVDSLSKEDRLELAAELSVPAENSERLCQALIRKLISKAKREKVRYAPFDFSHFQYSIGEMPVYAEVVERTGLLKCRVVAFSAAAPYGERGEVSTDVIEKTISADSFEQARQRNWTNRAYACVCTEPPFWHEDYESRFVGVDKRNGRYGEVAIETCKHCGRKWLRYFVEYEAFSSSGRWYRGIVSPEMEAMLTPENAVEMLESLPRYFYGGSYFSTAGMEGSGPLRVDL